MAVEARDTGRGSQRRMPSSTGTPQDPGLQTPKTLVTAPAALPSGHVGWVVGVRSNKAWSRSPPLSHSVGAVKLALVVIAAVAAVLLPFVASAVGMRAAWWLLLHFCAPPAVGAAPAAAASFSLGSTPTGTPPPGGDNYLMRVPPPPLSVGGVLGGGWTPPPVTARVSHVRSGDPAVDEQMDLCTDAAARCIEVEGTQAACDVCVAECSDAAEMVLASSALSGDEKADLLTLAREQSARCEEDM
ncbi:hypothetical protein MMPV_007488 [Pyropia vietnamensis]